MAEHTQENHQESDFLSSKQLAIVDEIKFIQKIMANAETSYAAWERWFLTAMGALVAAMVVILKDDKLDLLETILPILGVAFAVMFAQIQNGNYMYASARKERWKELEKLLKDVDIGNGLSYMQILSFTENFHNTNVNNKWWKSCEWWKPPYTTWKVRQMYPIVFGLMWVIILFLL